MLCVFQQILVGLERSAKQFGFFLFICFFQFSSLTYVSSHIWEMCFFFFLIKEAMMIPFLFLSQPHFQST